MGLADATMRRPVLVGVGLAAGAGIAAVDNLAFSGEVSPTVVVAMLFAASAAAGALWPRHGWVAAATSWACVPLAHVVKHVLGQPDTLHPNTCGSILLLAVVSLVVVAIGTGCGILVRALTSMAAGSGPKRS